MGIDIRDGLQLECIHCALCIDACDEMMEKVGLPTGLIFYDSDKNINARRQGKPQSIKLIRPRTLMYVALIIMVSSIMGYAYFNRATLELTAQRDRNPLFVTLSNGDIRNGFDLKLSNRTGYAHEYLIQYKGKDASSDELGMRIDAIGYKTHNNSFIVKAQPGKLINIRLFISQAADKVVPSIPLYFIAEPLDHSLSPIMVEDFFKGPTH